MTYILLLSLSCQCIEIDGNLQERKDEGLIINVCAVAGNCYQSLGGVPIIALPIARNPGAVTHTLLFLYSYEPPHWAKYEVAFEDSNLRFVQNIIT